jgi:hypothetical protein
LKVIINQFIHIFFRRETMRNQIMCVAALLVAVLASSALALDPNLVAWYTFDEGSGTTAHDWAHGFDGTIHGATWAAGKIGGALSFDGVNDYIRVLDNPSLRFTQNSSFTLCAWVNPISSVGQGDLVSKWQTDSKTNLFTYVMEWRLESQSFGFGVCKSGSGYVELGAPSGTGPVGIWSHIACVYDNRNMKIYVNGELEASGYFPYNTGTNTADNDLGIGAGLMLSGIERYFGGILDDIRIYNRELTAEEIKTIPEPGTIALLGLGGLVLRKRRA